MDTQDNNEIPAWPVDGLNEEAIRAFSKDYGDKFTGQLIDLVEDGMTLEDFVTALGNMIGRNHEDYFFWIDQFLRCYPWENSYLSLHSRDWMDDQITRRKDNDFEGGPLNEPVTRPVHTHTQIYAFPIGDKSDPPNYNFPVEQRFKMLRDKGVVITHLMDKGENNKTLASVLIGLQ